MLILSSTVRVASDMFRNISMLLDKGVYGILELTFSLFFGIVNNDIIKSDIVKVIFNRVFMIIGVFMVFKLIISFINYAVNPDSLTDKNTGVGKLVSRVIISMLLLVVLMPMNIYESDQYKNQGLLFGMLSEVQKTIIQEGTLSRLILGTSSLQTGSSTDDIGKAVSWNVFSTFYYPIEDTTCTTNKAAPTDLNSAQDLVNETCIGNDAEYIFNYTPFISSFVGIGVTVLVFMFTFDIAIRAIKLAILRMISPIPAISYIDPKSAKGGAFESYLKMLGSTYIELFVRLAIIYFCIFMIGEVTQGNVVAMSGSSLNAFAKLIVIISLLIFAKQAPKFFKDALGIKGDFGGSAGFKGIAALAGGAAGIATGIAGGIAAGRATGGAKGFARGIFSAATGATSGLFRGGSNALQNTKDNTFAGLKGGISSGIASQKARNANKVAYAGAGIGLRARQNAKIANATGLGYVDRQDKKLEALKSAQQDAEALQTMIDGKASAQEMNGKTISYKNTNGVDTDFPIASGNTASFKDWKSAYENALTSGSTIFKVNGQSIATANGKAFIDAMEKDAANTVMTNDSDVKAAQAVINQDLTGLGQNQISDYSSLKKIRKADLPNAQNAIKIQDTKYRKKTAARNLINATKNNK